jgi:hypothetical protein
MGSRRPAANAGCHGCVSFGPCHGWTSPRKSSEYKSAIGAPLHLERSWPRWPFPRGQDGSTPPAERTGTATQTSDPRGISIRKDMTGGVRPTICGVIGDDGKECCEPITETRSFLLCSAIGKRVRRPGETSLWQSNRDGEAARVRRRSHTEQAPFEGPQIRLDLGSVGSAL